MGLTLKSSINRDVLGLSPEAAKEWQKRTEAEFRLWADRKQNCDAIGINNFDALQQLALVSWLMSGDVFAVFKRYPSTPVRPYSLRVHLVEADRISTPNRMGGRNGFISITDGENPENGNRIFDGVEVNSDGMVVAYHVCNSYPWQIIREPQDWTRVEAYGPRTGLPNILHVMNSERCDQYRGVTYLAARNEAWDKAQVSIYKRKCGLSDMVISNMMAKTTYMTGTEAVEKGFANKVLEDAAPLDIAASADGRSLFVRGRQFHLTPGMFAPDTIPTVTPEAAAPVEANNQKPAQTGGQNGGNIMAKTLEELRKEDPALAEQLMAEARAAVSASGAPAAPAAPPTPSAQGSVDVDPVQAERQRLQDIDALASVFDAETINAAKYGEHRCTAQEMVYAAAQKASQQGGKFLAALMADTKGSGAQDVDAANGAGNDGAGGTGGPDSPQAVVAQAQADAKAFNERKREVR